MSGISIAELRTYAIILLVLITVSFAVCALFRKTVRPPFRKRGRKLRTSTSTWRSYIRDQGTLLFGFLLVGGVLASLASYFGPSEGKISKGGRLIEYHELNPTEHVIYEEQDVEAYQHITVLARTMAPHNSSAIVAIYGDPKPGGEQEINQIEAVADSWARWDQQNSCKHITLKITNGRTMPGATQVDVLIYLFPK